MCTNDNSCSVSDCAPCRHINRAFGPAAWLLVAAGIAGFFLRPRVDRGITWAIDGVCAVGVLTSLAIMATR